MELSAKVHYAILRLTYDELKDEKTDKNNVVKYNKKIDTIQAEDPYHFTILVHPHAHLKQQMKERGNEEKWEEPQFGFEDQPATIPPILLFQEDNVEWCPSHRKWGFYSNFAGFVFHLYKKKEKCFSNTYFREVFMWGKLLQIVEKHFNLKDNEFLKHMPKITLFSQLQQ